jgi:hypothetical protein
LNKEASKDSQGKKGGGRRKGSLKIIASIDWTDLKGVGRSAFWKATETMGLHFSTIDDASHTIDPKTI